jgi:ribosomal-protein-alanine N-acetyltransferase
MAAYVRGFDGQVRAIIGIFAKDAAKLVGVLLLEISPVHRAIRVSFFIGEADHRRRGAMSEVLVALAAHVFAETPIEKLGAVVASDNEASRRTLLASGFHEEATLKSEIISTATNTRLDQHFFAILKPEA